MSEHVVGDRDQADYRAHHHQVVAGIYLAVCYYVAIVEVDYQRDRVACIRQSITVGVYQKRIRSGRLLQTIAQAIIVVIRITGIAASVSVRVQLAAVAGGGAIVTRIANQVSIGVGLAVVGDERAVVVEIAERVRVGIDTDTLTITRREPIRPDRRH